VEAELDIADLGGPQAIEFNATSFRDATLVAYVDGAPDFGFLTLDSLFDSDFDGALNPNDHCPSVAPSFDPNGNGCDGPFARIKPVLRRTTVFAAGLTRFVSPRLVGLPAGAKVVLRRGSQKETLSATARGLVRSHLLEGTFAAGTAFSLLITKRDWIGYSARLVVTSDGTGVRATKKRCTPPSGRPVRRPCASIDHGS
jgi:hypothetical protein